MFSQLLSERKDISGFPLKRYLKVRNMGKIKCLVRGCFHYWGDQLESISFFMLPFDPTTRKKWIDAIPMMEQGPKSAMKICSNHFRPEDLTIYSGGKRFKKGAVPSFFRAWRSSAKKQLQARPSSCFSLMRFQ